MLFPFGNEFAKAAEGSNVSLLHGIVRYPQDMGRFDAVEMFEVTQREDFSVIYGQLIEGVMELLTYLFL